MQAADYFHGILIGSVEHFFTSGILNLQLLIIVAVKGVESISIVHHNIEQRTAILWQFLLILNSATKDLYQLTQFVIFL